MTSPAPVNPITPEQQEAGTGGVKRDKLVTEMAANRTSFVAGNRAAMESSAWPMRPERILADLRAVMPRDGTTFATVFEKDGKSDSPDYAAIARAYGIEGIKIESAAELKPALERAIALNRPVVLDVYMKNEPVPTNTRNA